MKYINYILNEKYRQFLSNNNQEPFFFFYKFSENLLEKNKKNYLSFFIKSKYFFKNYQMF